ncbi:LysR family transcriptional regulator ArgP [Desulfosediminicola sp.]|uniref:LysR family transcriptional regulator ArgP n=1 Tax=Desulfosediminicola sp. TaxID=2886825 RepID=UPI003AF2F785
MLDYKLLEAFAMVILEGGFEKAARKLCLTQSAVSQRVRQLEDLYGTILLKRTTPPQPTDSGLQLLIHYKKVKQLERDLDQQNSGDENTFHSLSIGVNADTLETWFFSSVQRLLHQYNIVLDLQVDDQDMTHELLKDGKVWGCISTRPTPQQGCTAEFLGAVRYGIYAAPIFKEKWFSSGINLDVFQNAPLVRFNRKDELSRKILTEIFGELPKSIADHSGLTRPPVFFVPSTEIYALFVTDGLCWGVLPEQQSKPLESSGKIVNLSPENYVDVNLFWHSWTLKSETMQCYSKHFITQAREVLHN